MKKDRRILRQLYSVGRISDVIAKRNDVNPSGHRIALLNDKKKVPIRRDLQWRYDVNV